MIRLAMLLAPVVLLIGCGSSVQTLGPEEFLFAYRTGSLKDRMSGGGAASYDGQDEAYHYISVRSSSPSDQLIYGESGQKLRCLVVDLPAGFPQNFMRPTHEQAVESTRDAEEYVEEYLKRYKPRRDQPRRHDRDDDFVVPKDAQTFGR